jgi:hypothetical protein
MALADMSCHGRDRDEGFVSANDVIKMAAMSAAEARRNLLFITIIVTICSAAYSSVFDIHFSFQRLTG